MKLAEIHEANGHPRKALELVHQGLCYHCVMILLTDGLSLVIDSRKRRIGGTKDDGSKDDGEETTAPSLFAERTKTKTKPPGSTKPGVSMSRQQLIDMEGHKDRDTKASYDELIQLQDAMRQGDSKAENEWLIYAENLIEMFRETRSLFMTRSVSNFGSRILDLP